MKSGKSIKGVLNYNEQKVSLGKAELILATKFACDVSELTFSQKLRRFEQLNNKSQKVNTNAMHISLNFAIGEKPDTGIFAKNSCRLHGQDRFRVPALSRLPTR